MAITIPFAAFFIIYLILLIICFVLGVFIFNPVNDKWKVGPKDFDRLVPRMAENAWYLVIYLFAIISLGVVISLYPYYHSVFSYDFSHVLMEREGRMLSSIQQNLENEYLTFFLAVIYVTGIVYVLIISPVLVMLQKSFAGGMKKYTYLIVLNIAIALPFFILFPVTVPSRFAPGTVRPLLYDDPNLYNLVLMFGGEGGMHNSFPSHHVSITFSVFIFMLLNWKKGFQRYAVFSGFIAMTTLLATLYLGIHYIADVLGGLALAIVSNVLAVYLARERRTGVT